MVYQVMFAIITPGLIAGAFAERMKFSAMMVFMILWSIVVYDPMAHMVWGKGGLLNAALGGRFPTLDFAGGTVVHITSGVSALVCALYLGKRVGYPKDKMVPHSVVLSFIGACLLWVGWLASTLEVLSLRRHPRHQRFRQHPLRRGHRGDELGPGGMVSRRQTQRPRSLPGAVAGLVAIPPAAGFVQPMSALAIGFLAGIFCYLMVTKVKAWFSYDDSLDAFGVH